MWQTGGGAKQFTHCGGPSLTEDLQTERVLTQCNQQNGVVVRASASQLVDLVSIFRTESYQNFKKTASLFVLSKIGTV